MMEMQGVHAAALVIDVRRDLVDILHHLNGILENVCIYFLKQIIFLFSAIHQIRDLENIIDPIIILDRQDVLLNAAMEEIQEKLFFDYGTTLHPESLYSEQLPGGFIQVYLNQGALVSKVNIEALFNAAHSHKELIKGIFSK